MTALPSLFATWRAAESPAVDIERVSWRELERVQRAAAALRPFAESSSIAASTLGGVFAVRRVLTCTPLAPSHELVGLTNLIDNVEQFVNDRPDHSLCEPLRAFVAALRELAATGSPVAAHVADVLSDYGEGADGSPEAILVMPRREWVNAVRTWLVNEDFDRIDVACLADLRTRLVTHTSAVLLGHPAIAYSSAFKSPDVAIRESGWVLTAPMAPRVRLVLTADAPSLRANELWLLPAAAHPLLHVCDDGARSNGPVPYDLLHESGFAAPVRRMTRPTVPAGEEQTRAVEVHLASGHITYFHREFRPRPHLVAFDGEAGAVALSASTISAVNRGVVLALRVGLAPHEQVVRRADTWLQRRRGWSPEKIADVRGCAAALKVALRHALAYRGREALHRQLARTLTDDYARMLLHNPLDDLYIAPQRRAGFDALITAVGARDVADMFDDFAAVRTAHQQAGEEIRRALLTLLQERRWVADVDENGWSVLHAGDLGALLLAVVTDRLDEPVPAAPTWLGALFDNNGRRVTTLAPKVGAT